MIAVDKGRPLRGNERPVEILVFSDDWGRHPSSAQHLVSRLLPRYPVTWCNTIGTRLPGWDLYSFARGIEKLRGWTRVETQVSAPAGRAKHSTERDRSGHVAQLPVSSGPAVQSLATRPGHHQAADHRRPAHCRHHPAVGGRSGRYDARRSLGLLLRRRSVGLARARSAHPRADGARARRQGGRRGSGQRSSGDAHRGDGT